MKQNCTLFVTAVFSGSSEFPRCHICSRKSLSAQCPGHVQRRTRGHLLRNVSFVAGTSGAFKKIECANAHSCFVQHTFLVNAACLKCSVEAARITVDCPICRTLDFKQPQARAMLPLQHGGRLEKFNMLWTFSLI